MLIYEPVGRELKLVAAEYLVPLTLYYDRRKTMRRNVFKTAFALAFLSTVQVAAQNRAALAQNAELKTMIEAAATSYMECYAKKDPACIAALYTTDGIMVNPTGIQKPVEVYTPAFAAGFNKLDAKVTSASTLGADSAIATGTYHITGKDKDGKDLDAAGKWTAAYVKDGGTLKVRMLTAVPNPPAR